MFVLSCFSMTATQFTQEEAKQVAQQFLRQKVSKVSTPRVTKVVPIKKVKSTAASNNDSKTMVYAVNMGKNEGFVIVAGNGYNNNVIGYSDHGALDDQKMPSNMRSWLESYMACAGDNVNATSTPRHIPSGIPTKTPIQPLLTSKWGQNQPYNDGAPIIDEEHCPTGCTITAMAQVMNYHKWPKAATQAIPAYTPNNSAGTSYPSLPALEPTIFNWENIYPSYEEGEDGTEVARLLKYLGTAACTDYTIGGSSATGYNALLGMIKYFDYDAGGHAVWRSERSYNEWVDMLYAELQAKRPVMFSGTSIDAAHSFVVDGYDEDDYFHVNWGWDGTSDGYYRVILMDPREQGTGGSPNNEAYISGQVAFFDVKPNSGGISNPRITVLTNHLLTDPNGTGSYTTPGTESTSSYDENYGYLVYPQMNSHNFNIESGVFELGCRLIKDDGSVTIDYPWDQSANFTANSGFENHAKVIYLDPVANPQLTDGNYKMYFTSRMKGSNTWLIDKGSENHYMIINLNHAARKLTTTAVSLDPKLTIKAVKLEPETPIVNVPCIMTFTVQNTGTGTFQGALELSNLDTSSPLSFMTCDIEPGETKDINMRVIPKKVGTTNYAILKDNVDNIYTGSFTVAESAVANSNCDLTITHQVTNAQGTEIAAPRAKIDLTITNNSDHNYYGGIFIYCTKYTGNNSELTHTMHADTIPAHQTVVLHRESPELTGGERYRFSTRYIKNGREIEQEIPDVYYTTVPYYISYDAEGNESFKRWASNLQPDASECAIDLASSPEVTSVNTSANPNLIIYASDDSPLTGDNIVKKERADNVKLSDQYPYYIHYPFTANHISYTRTPERYYDAVNNKGWTTLVLPFAATSCHATIDGVVKPLNWFTGSANGDILIATYQYENGSEMIFGFPESTLKSFTPYILGMPSTLNRGSSLMNVPITFSADNEGLNIDNAAITGRNYKMKGTFKPIKDEKNIYVLNADGSAFVLGTNSVNPFNSYFVPISSQTPADMLTISLYFDTPTSIGEIIDQQQKDLQGPIYNLNGQRVTRPSRGIYIVNGKKVIIK